MMTIEARRTTGNYKAYVSWASSILTLQLEKEAAGGGRQRQCSQDEARKRGREKQKVPQLR